MSIENTESTANHETAVVVTLWSRVGDLNSLWHTIPPSVQSMYLVEQLTDGVWETKLTRFDKIELIRTGVRRSEAYIYRRDETLVRVLTSAGIEAKQIVTVNGVQPLTGKLRVSVEHEKVGFVTMRRPAVISHSSGPGRPLMPFMILVIP